MGPESPEPGRESSAIPVRTDGGGTPAAVAPHAPGASPRRVLAAAGLIVLAGVLVYANSLRGPFIFDDDYAIVKNPTIRQLWPLTSVLRPPHGGMPTDGRPLLNLSFALNYALGGLNVWGYHATNLAIHVLAGLALFGILHRTLRLPRFRECTGPVATGLALVAALIWTVHPLQTESVTYVSQRAESLMGLLYLLTLYLALRGFAATQPRWWHAAAVGACLLGMATKEVMVSAPLLVLLYDRAFVSASFRQALRQRRGFYAALALTWVLLAGLVAQTGNRGGSVVFGQGSAAGAYALAQCGAIVHYLRLSLWPEPLVLDYQASPVRHARDVLPYALALGVLAGGTLATFRRHAWLGFLGVWFFAILAPSSSAIPIATQTMAEHRMYLALAAPVVLAVLLGNWAWRHRPMPSACGGEKAAATWRVPATVALAVVAVLGARTGARNADYASEVAIWEDTARKQPGNDRAWNNWGAALAAQGRAAEAMARYREALRIRPDSDAAHYNLGRLLAAQGQADAAIAQYRETIGISPRYADAHNHWGTALAAQGKRDEAMAHYRMALEIRPDYADAHCNLGLALAASGDLAGAIAHLHEALRISPDSAEAHNNLGIALAARGDLDGATAHFRRALAIQPNSIPFRRNLDAAAARTPPAP